MRQHKSRAPGRPARGRDAVLERAVVEEAVTGNGDEVGSLLYFSFDMSKDFPEHKVESLGSRIH